MAPTVPSEGFWGPPTATIDWCEKNYQVSFYVAEWCLLRDNEKKINDLKTQNETLLLEKETLLEDLGLKEVELTRLRQVVMDMTEEGVNGGLNEWREVKGHRGVASANVGRARRPECVVRLVSDSHGRGCGDRLRGSKIGDKFQILENVQPGTSFMSMIDRAGEVTKQAGDYDFVLMVGGSNAISNQTNLELGSGLDNLAEGLKGRVLWVETPYRFDSPDKNEVIKKQNEIIQHKCKLNNWAFLNINSMLDRTCFTRHGLHLNKTGKDVLNDLIINYLSLVSPKKALDEKNAKIDMTLENT
ncbi:hypothetical protein J6590_009579 [Homalodisca vitripennis]|nr:hypothetical protein J6590_009579 [Homalodisca vitripennis]